MWMHDRLQCVCFTQKSYLAEYAAALAMRLLHQAEDGEVPVADLAHQRIQTLHHQGLRGQDGLVLGGSDSTEPPAINPTQRGQTNQLHLQSLNRESIIPRSTTTHTDRRASLCASQCCSVSLCVEDSRCASLWGSDCCCYASVCITVCLWQCYASAGYAVYQIEFIYRQQVCSSWLVLR